MKMKRKAAILLVVILLLGTMLVGCNDGDKENINFPTETNQPQGQPPSRPIFPINPNAPPTRHPDGSPIRHPDGSVG